jgi:hypothetical protein
LVLARVPIVTIVAVLDTNPEANPASGRPNRGPEADCDVPGGLDRHDEDDDPPHCARIDGAERADVAVFDANQKPSA